jgi:hypothetical protein
MIHRITASLLLIMCAVGCASKTKREPTTVRFATFNASLNRDAPGQLVRDLSTPDNQQAKNVAEIIQRVRPDVLLINEFDYEETGEAPKLFQSNYLSVAQNGAQPIEYPYRVYLTVNTGVFSGHDLDNDGKIVSQPGTRGYGNDCFGFGQFPGQYGMLLLSKFPADFHISFQEALWNQLEDAQLPRNADGTPWYSNEELSVLRLSSKSHWVVRLRIGESAIHALASHPTPPAFDGPEDRNGKRNHDEIRLWKEYLDDPIMPLMKSEPFIILGDLNADPQDGNSVPGAIQQLLDHPRVNASVIPRSAGGAEAAIRDDGLNASHKSPPDEDTADFGDAGNAPGNLRCDYVLPSKDLTVVGSGIFWPTSDDPLHRLVQMKPNVASSDHRLVYIDVVIQP